MKFELSKYYPGSTSTLFLEERILNNKYRGRHLSQHNRYGLSTVEIMLETLYKYTRNSPLLIRTTDLSKRPYNTQEETSYANYVTEISNLIGRCTQDSVRKNFFVEFSRMGFLNRYDKKMNLLDPYESHPVKYVEVSKLGIAFFAQKNLVNQSMLFARGVDNVLKGMASDIFQAMIQLNYLTIEEYTYFMSFIGCELNGKIYFLQDIIDFIIEFRKLSIYQRSGINTIIKDYCNPNHFFGNKTIKRDLHNWINEGQQIFTVLNDTAYYEYDKNAYNPKLIFKVNTTLLNNQTPIINIKRSILQKSNYFQSHNVSKIPGFELHHIVPLFWAKNPVEFSILDDWQNMIYIDAKSHSIITNYSPNCVELSFINEDIRLVDTIKRYIDLKKDQNVIYNSGQKNNMIVKNEKILRSF
jgi:hypothetical protein